MDLSKLHGSPIRHSSDGDGRTLIRVIRLVGLIQRVRSMHEESGSGLQLIRGTAHVEVDEELGRFRVQNLLRIWLDFGQNLI